MNRNAFIAAAVGVGMLLSSALFSTVSAADEFPSKRITLIVPFPAGSATDGTARRLAAEMSRIGKVPVIVDNKPGADGNLAALAVLRSDPDGYTVFITTNSTHAANVNLFNTLPYDPKRDFTPVTGIAKIPMMIAVKSDFPAKNIGEFIALSKKAGKPLSFGSANQTGRGAGELFKERAGLTILNVPYKGSPQGLTDLMGGHIDSFMADPVSALGLTQKGSIRVLAVTSNKRAPTMPDVPTIEESGFPGFELIAWIAAFVPEKTPRPVVARLNAMLTSILNDPATASYLQSTGAAPFPTTPEELGAFAESDTARWARIVEAAKMEKQ
jgi:tripartite-type tricarboxylate transporter receptor subunit TctC